MSTITPAALKQLKAQGYKLVFEKFGPAGCGKTRAADKEATSLRARGNIVVIEDEIFENNEGGVRIWARKK